jgi:hypothetical protein
MAVGPRASATTASAVKGGHKTRSTPSISFRGCRIRRTKSRASRGPPRFIFQFAARMGLRMLDLPSPTRSGGFRRRFPFGLRGVGPGLLRAAYLGDTRRTRHDANWGRSLRKSPDALPSTVAGPTSGIRSGAGCTHSRHLVNRGRLYPCPAYLDPGVGHARLERRPSRLRTAFLARRKARVCPASDVIPRPSRLQRSHGHRCGGVRRRHYRLITYASLSG